MTDTLPLMKAAVILGKSYNQTLRLVLIGEIKGEQRNGRWFLDSGDVARLARSRGGTEGGPR
jgi:hypothetical protein